MTEDIRIAFEPQVHTLPLLLILPSRQVSQLQKESAKYRVIASSMAEVGLVEPLVVAPRVGKAPHLLLDGHLRLYVMRDLGHVEARCLIADDDESFTYNRRVSRLAPIQEHHMIVRAVDRGVSEQKLARALNVDPKVIRQRRNLLAGICVEVAELLKDKPIGAGGLYKLRQMKPIRQLEVAELMISANNYSINYARALLATTKPGDLLKPELQGKATGLSIDQMARLEREMSGISEDYRAVEASYGDDMLVLVIAAGFLERLISKPEIERFLSGRHPEFLENFRAVVSASSLDQAGTA